MEDDDDIDGLLGEFAMDEWSRPPSAGDLLPRLDESDELSDWQGSDE